LDVILQAIRLLCQILLVAILIRVIISWVAPTSRNAFVEILFTITEPVLAPIRRLLPRTGMFDISPLIAMIALQVIIYASYYLG
jgi:YggT family protein